VSALGQCPVCNRLRPLTTAGTLRQHTRTVPAPAGKPRHRKRSCTGSGRWPVELGTTTSLQGTGGPP
jgi:hypothetical protein